MVALEVEGLLRCPRSVVIDPAVSWAENVWRSVEGSLMLCPLSQQLAMLPAIDGIGYGGRADTKEFSSWANQMSFGETSCS